ncbi:MAG: DUF2303 family protein [Nannocystaceae bacterium]
MIVQALQWLSTQCTQSIKSDDNDVEYLRHGEGWKLITAEDTAKAKGERHRERFRYQTSSIIDWAKYIGDRHEDESVKTDLNPKVYIDEDFSAVCVFNSTISQTGGMADDVAWLNLKKTASMRVVEAIISQSWVGQQTAINWAHESSEWIDDFPALLKYLQNVKAIISAEKESVQTETKVRRSAMEQVAIKSEGAPITLITMLVTPYLGLSQFAVDLRLETRFTDGKPTFRFMWDAAENQIEQALMEFQRLADEAVHPDARVYIGEIKNT